MVTGHGLGAPTEGQPLEYARKAQTTNGLYRGDALQVYSMEHGTCPDFVV